MRAAQANAALLRQQAQGEGTNPPQAPPPPATVNPVMMEMDQNAPNQDVALPPPPPSPPNHFTMDPMLQQQDAALKGESPSAVPDPGPEEFHSPYPQFEGMGEMMQLSNEFLQSDAPYTGDMSIWGDVNLGLDIYQGVVPLDQPPPELVIPTNFNEIMDTVSSSDPTNSSRTS